MASFLSYGIETQYGARKAQMGSGIPEGIVAPQTAATSSVGGAMIPLITMGIPGSGATAIILGAFLLHGLQPGPQVFETSSHIVYAVFASVFVGVILGPLAETNFMTTMISFNNDWTVFFTRPVSGPIMAIGVFTLVYPVIRHLRHRAGRPAARNAGK